MRSTLNEQPPETWAQAMAGVVSCDLSSFSTIPLEAVQSSFNVLQYGVEEFRAAGQAMNAWALPCHVPIQLTSVHEETEAAMPTFFQSSGLDKKVERKGLDGFGSTDLACVDKACALGRDKLLAPWGRNQVMGKLDESRKTRR